jgi:hypothetical protein
MQAHESSNLRFRKDDFSTFSVGNILAKLVACLPGILLPSPPPIASRKSAKMLAASR